MTETKGELLEKIELKEPPLYKVVLNNDDYTTMDFVVMVLMIIFHKTKEESRQIMLSVHKNGKGLCGVYPYDVAETKQKQVDMLAERHKFPLKCTLEEV